jgi:hypothetical protein
MKINNPRNVSFGDCFFVIIRIENVNHSTSLIYKDNIPKSLVIPKLYLYLLNSQNL